MNVENRIIELEHIYMLVRHTHIDHIYLAVLRMDLRASCLLGFPLSPIESDVVGQPSSPHSSFADRAKDNRKVLSS